MPPKSPPGKISQCELQLVIFFGCKIAYVSFYDPKIFLIRLNFQKCLLMKKKKQKEDLQFSKKSLYVNHIIFKVLSKSAYQLM